jgi:hypothetical protein
VVSKSLRKIAKDLKKPILVFEGGEALRLENYIVTKGIQVMRNLLIKKGMLDGELKSLEHVKVFRKTIWERSPKRTACLPSQSREFVRKDERCDS